MSAPSPNLIRSGQVTFTVMVDGKALLDTIGVVSIETWVAVNKVPRARLIIFDGSAAKQDFEISNQNLFLPGAKVDISLGYPGTAETKVFSGVVVAQSIEIDTSQPSRLLVDISDDALRMTLERKNGVFEKIKDSDLIGKLIAANGLKKSVATTNVVHEEIVQYYASDWDLMLMRAELNGFVVTVDAGTVTVKAPNTSSTPALTVTYGESILDFHAEMDATTQVQSSAVKSYAWDPSQQKLIDAGPSPVNVTEPGNVTSAQLAKVFDIKKYPQQTGAPVEKGSLSDWSSAEILKSKLSKIRGTVSFQGSALVVPGKTIELAGVGKRFNGKAYVSGVNHSVRDGKWITTAEFGLSALWFAAAMPRIAAPGASGLLPPIQGLQTGIVKKVAKDPGGEYRVEIELPLLQMPGQGVWARLSSFYASNKVGDVFYPEIGDEVVVGFMNQDPSYPIILGSLYSKKIPPPVAPDEKNNKKAIVTRSKLEISFDDQDKIIEINTPGKNVIRLDDKAGKITISDGSKNSVTLAKSGVTIESAASMTLKSKGNMTLDAGANLKLSAKANASMDGLQVAHTAKGKFSANGNGMAELKSSGILTVRGTLVKIN